MQFTNKIADSDSKYSAANRFRNERFKFFESLIARHSFQSLSVLDIGGTASFWQNRGYSEKENTRITLLNLSKEQEFGNVSSLVGDATDLSQFPDKSFDVVFSNSVIEHLYTRENQQKMANEVQRVGKYYFIQTPNKYFPIEPHLMLPLFQFYPEWLQFFILSKTKWARGKRLSQQAAKDKINEIQLLSEKELRSLFPGCKVYKEKFWGFTKSITAYNL